MKPKVLLLPFLVVGLLACSTDPSTAPGNDPQPGEAEIIAVVITLPPGRAETLLAGDTVTVTATAYAPKSREITTGFFEWQGAAISPTGTRTALMIARETPTEITAVFKRPGWADVHGRATITAARIPGIVLLWTPGKGTVRMPAPEGASRVDAGSVNDRGEVAGTATYPDRTQAFVWSEKLGYRELSVPLPVRSTAAIAISENGMVIGSIGAQYGPLTKFAWTPETGLIEIGSGLVIGDVNRADEVIGTRDGKLVMWTRQDGVRELGSANGWNQWDMAVDINDKREILVSGNGRYTPGIDYGFAMPANPSIWVGGTRFSFDCGECVLSAMNNDGVVVGNSFEREGRAFKWTRDKGIEMLARGPGGSADIYAIDESGVIAGAVWLRETFWRTNAAIWKGDEIILLPNEWGARSSVARDINNVGQVLVVVR